MQLRPLLFVGSALLICGCGPDPSLDAVKAGNIPSVYKTNTNVLPKAWVDSVNEGATNIETNSDLPTTDVEPQEVPPTVVPPVPPPTPDLPYGVPVPGKPGLVASPYTDKGYVDVRGFPTGSEVRDPYSGKTFLVP